MKKAMIMMVVFLCVSCADCFAWGRNKTIELHYKCDQLFEKDPLYTKYNCDIFTAITRCNLIDKKDGRYLKCRTITKNGVILDDKDEEK